MRSSFFVSFLFSTLMACAANDPLPNPNHGTEGDKTLTSTDVVAPGDHCPAGGLAHNTGIDTNRNGVLDPSEINSTTYACSHKALMRDDAIASGTVCPGGGANIRTGHDLNDDGTLEDPEIESSTVLCNSDALYEGDLKTSDFATPEAQDKLSRVRVVTGKLTIDSAVAMPSLTRVGGNLDLEVGTLVELPALTQIVGTLVGPPQVIINGQAAERPVMLRVPALTEAGSIVMTSWGTGEFSAPALTSVDDDFDLSGSFTTLELGALTRVGYQLQITGIKAPALDLPALVSVVHEIRLNGAMTEIDLHSLQATSSISLYRTNITSLSLPALESSVALHLTGMTTLTSLSMPKLTTASGLWLNGATNLASLDLSSLGTAGDLRVSDLPVTDLAAFSSLRSLGSLEVTACPNLVDLGGLDLLTSATSVTVINNPALQSFAGIGHLAKLDGSLTIQGNAALASLADLAALTNVSGSITISGNAALPATEVAAFLARLGR